MVKTKDPLLDVFRNRHDPAAREAFMKTVRRAAAERGDPKKNKTKGKGKAVAIPPKKGDHLTLDLPATATLGTPLTVRIIHTLHDDLGPQKLHVTLKQRDNTRIERKVIDIQGNATAEVTFDVPTALPTQALIIAAFVGEDITTALHHLNSKPIPLE
jgi:hypothetical protein